MWLRLVDLSQSPGSTFIWEVHPGSEMTRQNRRSSDADAEMPTQPLARSSTSRTPAVPVLDDAENLERARQWRRCCGELGGGNGCWRWSPPTPRQRHRQFFDPEKAARWRAAVLQQGTRITHPIPPPTRAISVPRDSLSEIADEKAARVLTGRRS